MAVEYDYYDVIFKLLENKADPKIKNNSGFEAMDGIDGKKEISLIALMNAETSENMNKALDELINSDEKRKRLDKAELVQVGMKVYMIYI